jgi:hypothetical protein
VERKGFTASRQHLHRHLRYRRRRSVMQILLIVSSLSSGHFDQNIYRRICALSDLRFDAERSLELSTDDGHSARPKMLGLIAIYGRNAQRPRRIMLLISTSFQSYTGCWRRS